MPLMIMGGRREAMSSHMTINLVGFIIFSGKYIMCKLFLFSMFTFKISFFLHLQGRGLSLDTAPKNSLHLMYEALPVQCVVKGMKRTIIIAKIWWSSSSKAMEPHTVAKLIACNEAFLTAGVPVSTLIGDGDSSMLAVQRESQHSHLSPYFGLYFFFHYAGVGRGNTTRGEVQLPVYANNIFGA